MAIISKKILTHLAELTRIELTPTESQKLLKDLKKILDYFDELKTISTEKIQPITGDTNLRNVFREDEVDFAKKSETINSEGRIIDGFPKTEKGYLRVPKIF